VVTAGEYEICTNSNAGSRITIDGQEAVASPGMHAPEHTCNHIMITPGEHLVEVKYFENGRSAALVVSYSGPDTQGREYLMPSVWHDVERCGPAPA